MSLIDTILGRNPEKKKVLEAGHTFKMVTAYKPVFHDWRGEIYESELVRAAIDARARNISKLKVEFVGTSKPDLVRKLTKRPNPWNTWSQFLYRVSTILDCTNNCIIVPIYDDGMNKIGVYPLIPTKCSVVDYKGELWIKYTFREGRESGAVRMSECALLTKFQFRSDFFGSSQAPLDETMQLMKIQTQGLEEAVKNGAIYRFMAKLTNFTKGEDLDREQEAFTERNFSREAKGSGGILLFPNTYSDIKQIDSKPYTVDEKQMQLIRQNVYSYFGVNEDVLMNKAVGDSWAAFYEGAIEPFAIQFSETLTFALFSQRETSEGSMVMATANRLQYASTQEKKEISEMAADRGLMSIDEIREIWNLAPLPDGQGQRYVARGEYYFIQEEDRENGDQ